jgi:hypothetical protein
LIFGTCLGLTIKVLPGELPIAFTQRGGLCFEPNVIG